MNVQLSDISSGGYRGRLIEFQPRTKGAEIILGKNIATNNGVFLCCAKKITVGDDTLIGSNVTIMDHNAHGVKPHERRTSAGTPKEVEIGKNVWIGSDVFILPGTKIGDNSIVGAGAVVSGIFPKNVIIMGNPGVVIKEIKE
ncbi:MAG: acyltransferase [Fusobacteriaceae bacterium]